jgi:hypothetical protein
MNSDEQFENRLRRQPLRPISPAWREEILAAAAAHQPTVPTQSDAKDQAALVVGWRLLFARMPLTWAALAALWLGMVGVNLTMPGPMVSVAIEAPASTRWGALASLDSLEAEFDVERTSTVPVPKTSPAPPPTDEKPRPRSERRRGVDFGEAHPDFFFHIIA